MELLLKNIPTYIHYFAYVLAVPCAIFALWRSRTTQGATAWIVGLFGFPVLMTPLFLIFGRNKFQGYVKERRELDQIAKKEMGEIRRLNYEAVEAPEELKALTAVAKLARQPAFMDDNTLELLIDGEATFGSILESIQTAKKYILFQFYVIRPDEIGTKFGDALIAKAREGVKVYFLYDAIGTKLHSKFLKKLRKNGIEICRFNSTKFWNLQFQINFRNHRKLVVIDGHTAFVGGHNIGDDYLGKYPKIGPWRDTHCKIVGPCATTAQVSFVKDWFWATEKIINLDWDVEAVPGGDKACVLHTGPADDGEAALLAHIALVNSANKRIWIANPYFIPPEGLGNALAYAVMRGVEVKVLTPSYTDNQLVRYASETSAEKLMPLGIQYFRYEPGFLHQKVMLIDNNFAVVGSTNLDSRSLFVNFEIQAMTTSQSFVNDVESMLKKDFAHSKAWTLDDLAKRSRARQLLARAAALLNPVL